MFQEDTFDEETIERELDWAKDLGFNSLRVYLHDLLWSEKEKFKKNFDKFKTLVIFHGNAGDLSNRIYKLNELSKLNINILLNIQMNHASSTCLDVPSEYKF